MDINEALAKAKETIFNENMVKELIDPEIGDYERGIVAGRIEMMNWIEKQLGTNEEEE